MAGKQKRAVGAGGNLRLEWFYPDELEPNPANWRRHPDTQKRALEALLYGRGGDGAEGGAPADPPVGWVGAALYNETTGHLIDGHLRQKVALAHGGPMPVLVGSWTEEQERLILATLDPIAALAEADREQLAPLLQSVQSADADIQTLLAGLAEQEGLWQVDEPPSLDDLKNQFGEPGERDFWPVVKVQVAPDTFALYGSLMDRLQGGDDALKFKAIVEAADAALSGGG